MNVVISGKKTEKSMLIVIGKADAQTTKHLANMMTVITQKAGQKNMKDFEDMLKQHLDELQRLHYCHEIDYREYRELCRQSITSCMRELECRYGAENAEKVVEMYMDDYDIL